MPYVSRPGFVATLDSTPAPAVARGLHPTEFEAGGGLSFAWTEGRVTLIFEGLDRSRPWTLSLRARAGRGPGLPLPTATIGVDGTTLATAPIGPQWQDVRVVLPTEARTRPTRITVDVAPTFVPGPADSRTLGMILDEVRLVPDGLPSPPGRAVTAAATAGAIVAAVIVLVGVPAPWAIGLHRSASRVAQGLALSTGAAPYARLYLAAVPRMAGGAGILALIVAGVAAVVQRKPLSATAAAAVAIAGIALVLGLEGLLHPGKPYVDAVFHAHKLDDVLAGHYFFTQPMPSGVEFPYAIGLYVTAAPWASLTRDHVLLLRVVVATAHVLAALSLYPLVQSRWERPGAAVVAVAAYLLAPLPFVVIGNANQTYAFGQSVATIALASAMTWPFGWRRPVALVALVGARRAPGVGAALARRPDPAARRPRRRQRRAGRVARRRRRSPRRLAHPWRDADRDDPRVRALLPALRRRVPLGAAGRPGQQLGRNRDRRAGVGTGRAAERGRARDAADTGRDLAPAARRAARHVWPSRPTARRSWCSRSPACSACRSATRGIAPR